MIDSWLEQDDSPPKHPLVEEWELWSDEMNDLVVWMEEVVDDESSCKEDIEKVLSEIKCHMTMRPE